MNVLIVSQCSKKALKETRRIVDQFAERTGDRTWQTAITEQGLMTLRRLLKKTARRNTSVACHWIRGINRTELTWIVGNPRKFNSQGSVPTNVTGRDLLRTKDENLWQTSEDIRLLACIAALFHDFGKANDAFQNKINPKKKTDSYEPYRHEWVSVRMFEAFVMHTTQGEITAEADIQWIKYLANLDDEKGLELDKIVKETLVKDGIENKGRRTPLNKLPPVAAAVAWLILSHHRLPQPTIYNNDHINAPQKLLKYISSHWNSPQAENAWEKSEIEAVWTFSKGTPFLSETWRTRLSRVASHALKRPSFLATAWLHQPFSLHLARLSLMLGDHYYSSQNVVGKKSGWHDKQWGSKQADTVYANTWREKGSKHNGKYNQTLDDHLIGVYRNSHYVTRTLSLVKDSLPVITRHPTLKKRTTHANFAWQNKAYELAASVREKANTHGFFGVNIASTGKGKTLANARIMYGLADEAKGCRFSVALGLRTLTLQTGQAYKEMLALDDEDLAVMIGSSAVKALFDEENKRKEVKAKTVKASDVEPEIPISSESAGDFVDQDHYVSYDGSLGDGPLNKWLANSPKAQKLVSAPVLVSTIDHIMPATEGSRGGKQIAPMLRLLSSDLVLDEPDDFGLEDLPALCRLVNWAGMLGSKVLLSSATLPPDLINALFDAYIEGRKHYEASVNINPSTTTHLVCAWFDEYRSVAEQVSNLADFDDLHTQQMQARSAKLKTEDIKRRVQLVPARAGEFDTPIDGMAQRIHTSIHDLHVTNHTVQPNTGVKVSFGLVRMANIKPLVAVAKALFAMESPANTQVHYCVYHSQFLLLQRSNIENMLDTALNRKDPDSIWSNAIVQKAIQAAPNDQHIFVVLGSPVTEVGRDHSYNWAVVEPSSIRSLIQLAGRVLRHDQRTEIKHTNIHLLNQNYNALQGSETAYTRPGFETKALKLESSELTQLLEQEEYEAINALPRINKRPDLSPTKRFVDLEHAALATQLWGTGKKEGAAYASLWWKGPMHWTGILQKALGFRKSTPNDRFCYFIEEEGDQPAMYRWHDNGDFKCDDKQHFLREESTKLAQGNNIWGESFNYSQALTALAEERHISMSDAAMQFGTIELRAQESDGVWLQSPVLGFYKDI